MKLNEVFPSNYIKAADLQGREVTVIIAGAAMEQLGNDNKLVITFKGKEKGLVCNKTNAGRIAYLYGDDTDEWIGNPIVLAAELVDFQGKTVEAIRVRAPAKNGGATQTVTSRAGYQLSTGKAKPDPLGDEGDPIPF